MKVFVLSDVKPLSVPPETDISDSKNPITASLKSKVTTETRSESLKESATISTVTLGFSVSTLKTSS